MISFNPASGLLYSDARQKRDLQLVDILENGIKLFRYRYRWSTTNYVGVLAQEAGLITDAWGCNCESTRAGWTKGRSHWFPNRCGS